MAAPELPVSPAYGAGSAALPFRSRRVPAIVVEQVAKVVRKKELSQLNLASREETMKRRTESFFLMQLLTTCFWAFALFASITAMSSGPAFAQKKYDTGATDTEIKVGNIMPYSGPASAYGIIGRTMSAYMKMINDNGGVNGRKINFISYDDAYSPPKTVEQARKLVESDEVFLVFAPLGTPSNAAIQKYLNQRKVPQLFVATGASRWGDPEHFPWTIGLAPSYRSEARIYATYIKQNFPGKKIGILYQNDDFGK